MLSQNELFANRYRLLKRLGSGAFSEVWKAEDTKVGNLIVALKIYAPSKGLDEDGVGILSDEFAVVFDLHHQNLLTPSSFDEYNGSPYLVLPYCSQGNATKLVGATYELLVAMFLRDVSSALAYLHDADIVHQDIKPDNILINDKGMFLVTDFGISTKIRTTLRKSLGLKGTAGTVAYMAPERFSNNPMPIKASDIWSLGSTVFELMTGDVPFGDMGGGLQKKGAEIPDIHGDYSPALISLVKKCLSEAPWDRPVAATISDICERFIRTGEWDLSSLKKTKMDTDNSPEQDRERATRPDREGTNRMASKPSFEPPNHVEHDTFRYSPQRNMNSNPYKKEKSPVILAVLFVLFVAGIATAFIITQSKSFKRIDPGREPNGTVIIETEVHYNAKKPEKTYSPKKSVETTVQKTTTSMPTSKNNPATLTEREDPSRGMSVRNTNGEAMEMPYTNPAEKGAPFDEEHKTAVKRSSTRYDMLKGVDSTSWSGMRDKVRRR